MRVHEVIPVAKSGPLILLYPRWLPGNHSPSGPLDLLAGLSFHAGSTTLTWTRDPVDVYAFHINVPNGAHEVTADFQYLSPTQGNQGRVVATDVILNLEWNAVVLYPAGYFSRRIPVSAELKVPQGWGVGTALEPAGGGRFKTTSSTRWWIPRSWRENISRGSISIPAPRCRCIWTWWPTMPTSSKCTPQELAGAQESGAAGLQALWLASLRSL